jgi:alkanesulfonate monooxygenase SsuD/methylene tetrahydromethanopterin reductase-like flavin-dependent oxidoreductase (luciferase family)
MKVSYLCMTQFDGPAPGLDIWPAAPSYCDPALARQSVNRYLDQAVRAEQLGFDWISVSEHHYAPIQMTPNCVVMAAALSQRTQRAKIALLGPLVPLSNPVRLAEEIAMLDTLSGGRVVVLFLRGTPNEHGTYDTPPEATRGMTQEGIDLILKAWQTREPFAWSGEHYQFSTISVWPRVQQDPHPPVYGSGNSEESVRFAAERRIGIAFSFAPMEVVKRWVDLYVADCARAGWVPSADHVIYRGLAYVAPTDAQAAAEAQAFFGAKIAEQAQMQSKTLGGPPIVPLILQPFFFGSPATVLARYDELRDAGVGVTDLAFTIGSPAQQAEAIELFAREVLPELRRQDARHAATYSAAAD